MSTKSLASLASRVHLLADRAREGMEAKVKAAAKETAYETIKRTPVDTGEARSSWEAGINARPTGEHPPYAPNEPLFNKEATFNAGRFKETDNLEAAYQRAEAVIERYKLGDTIYITNAVKGDEGDHYLHRLATEAGYSKQGTELSPLFWIQKVAAMGREAARKVKVLR